MSDGGGWGRDQDGSGDGGQRPDDPPAPGSGWGDPGQGTGQPPGSGWGDPGQGTGQPPGSGWGDPGQGTGQPPGTGWGSQGQGQPPGGFPQQGQWGGGPGNLPPPPSGGSNTKAVAAIACGISSLVFIILFFPLGILLAIAGVVLGVMGAKEAKRTGAGGRGMAITGIVTGSLSLVLLVLGAIGLAFVFSQFDTNPFTDPEGFMEELEREGFEFDEEGNVVDTPDHLDLDGL